jgi:thiol-disulfide isomerase/thioredoxin
MNYSIKLLLLIVLQALLANCNSQDKNKNDMLVPKTNAPEIDTEFGWVNTDRSYSLKDFRGKFVLLDFWTYGCINCQHIIPDLERLEKEFGEELIVIGVHSAKFTGEQSNQRIKKAIAKFGIHHPVVNDADYKVWESYGVNAWPTVTLIDPDGKVVGQKSGEGVYAAVKPLLDKLIPQYKDKLSKVEFKFNLTEESASVLRFPSKLIASSDSNIWVSDSGHNRVLKISFEGKILDSIGSGKQGDKDAGFADAQLYEPHGLAQKGNLLYIADTKNNKIKVADLIARTVKTVAGTGEMGYYYFEDNQNEPVNPNSPWDLLIDGDQMFIASAGNHQILKMDLKSNKVYRFAGTGREALSDGEIKEAGFNQPSGLTKFGDKLFIADAEASAIREINLKTGEVTTLLGKGLFEFGDKDGSTEDALLQHAVGLEARENVIYIADTYNGKIKTLDVAERKISTLIKGLNEPNDLLFVDDFMFVTDTNNHQLMKFDLKTKQIEKVIIKKDQ